MPPAAKTGWRSDEDSTVEPDAKGGPSGLAAASCETARRFPNSRRSRTQAVFKVL